jgi:hypothetical protein
MIGKGHVFQPRRHHILIERSPAAIAALKTQFPGQRAFEQRFNALPIFWLNEAQRHQHHCRVVHVRIINVVVLEGPSACFRMQIIYGPIAPDSHLFVDQPICRTSQRRVFR